MKYAQFCQAADPNKPGPSTTLGRLRHIQLAKRTKSVENSPLGCSIAHNSGCFPTKRQSDRLLAEAGWNQPPLPAKEITAPALSSRMQYALTKMLAEPIQCLRELQVEIDEP
jgi:hypothetical protein